MSDYLFYPLKAIPRGAADGDVVYGLGSCVDKKIVYVGKSVNFMRRRETYLAPKRCHNQRLKQWLLLHGENAGVTILVRNPSDLTAAETNQISKFDNLFNVVHKDWEFNSMSMPWMARAGTWCPSEWSLRRRGWDAQKKAEVKAIISKMSVVDRCIFEIEVAVDITALHVAGRRATNRWWKFCELSMWQALGL